MSEKTKRISKSLQVTIAEGETESDAFALAYGGWGLGGFYMPAAFTGSTITFMVCSRSDGTFLALNDAENAAKSQAVSVAKAYQLPAELFGFMWVKLVSGAAESADRVIQVDLVT